MSSVTLTCMVDPTPSSSITYRWNTTGCYTNTPRFTRNGPECFPRGQTTQNVTGNDLNAEDAGTITCTVTISGSDYTSEPFTLRISGEQLVYCVIACIVYCKQCMLLLLATCYCCIIHQLLWFMYRGVFTVGVAVTRGSSFALADALTDYSYINVGGSNVDGAPVIARCLTGLGPSGNDNSVLGGWWYPNGTKMPNRVVCHEIISSIPGGLAAGVINIHHCRPFITAGEGVYTCTMMNSSTVEQSVRLGIYLNGRSESLDLYIPSLNHLSSLYTAAPVIDNSSSSIVKVNVGSSLTLNCTSQGSPPDTFTWRKNNDPTVLQSTSITAVDYTSTSAVFRADYSIDSVTTSDNGTYTCNVTNPIGSYNITITVLVVVFYGKLIIRYYRDTEFIKGN